METRAVAGKTCKVELNFFNWRQFMLDRAVVTCPNCEFDFDVNSDIFSDIFNVESAAERLLEKYQGGHPSLGDVQRLKDRLTEILVSEFNVSMGVI